AGMCTACRSALTRASYTSQGNSAVRSTSAARGAILLSARARADSRRALCSSDSVNAGKSRLMGSMVKGRTRARPRARGVNGQELGGLTRQLGAQRSALGLRLPAQPFLEVLH